MNANALYSVIGVVFVGALLIAYGAYRFWRGRIDDEKEWVSRRLGTQGEGGDSDEEGENEDGSLIQEKAADAIIEHLGSYGESLQTTITAADSDMTVTALVSRMAAMGLFIGAPFVVMMGQTGFMVGAFAAYMPLFFLKRQARKRTESLLQQLPDALELMSRAMQAGVGLSDSFRLVAEEMPLPVAREWGRVFEEIRFGKDWRDSLGGLLVRNPTIFDLRLLVSSILLQRDTGGNIIEILNKISETIRNRYVFDAKVAAMTSEARNASFIMMMMPLGVVGMLLLLNPDYLSPLVTDEYGQMILVYCVVSYGTGAYLMQNMSKVEV